MFFNLKEPIVTFGKLGVGWGQGSLAIRFELYIHLFSCGELNIATVLVGCNFHGGLSFK